MRSNFKALLIWMDRWGVVSPEAQRDFLNSFDEAYREQERPTLEEGQLRASIARHRGVAEILAEVRQRDDAETAAKEREKERVLAEADDRRRRVWPLRTTAALGLFLLWYFVAMFGWSGLPFAAVFLAVFLPWRYRRSVRKAEEWIERDERERRHPSPWSTSLRSGSRFTKFDVPFSTIVHPATRFATLAHGKRTCSHCGKSPPDIWLTVK
ncbi:uncharacterized protein METZ01_LOCUS413502, partial [marine metagenome]